MTFLSKANYFWKLQKGKFMPDESIFILSISLGLRDLRKKRYDFLKGRWVWCLHDNATHSWLKKAEHWGFHMRYCLFLKIAWFFQNLRNDWRVGAALVCFIFISAKIRQKTFWILRIIALSL